MSILDSALDAADRSFRVFPLKPGQKTPAVNAWQKKATTDRDVIEGWFKRWPGANFGIATGEGIAVLDIDRKNGTDGSDSLEAAGYLVPGETLRVITPSNGEHVYFRTDTKTGNPTGVVPGVDIRGDGGFVVGPGSRIDGVDYRIINDEFIADAPIWFMDLAKTHSKKESAIENTAEWDDNTLALHRAREYAEFEAPIAISGESGDRTAFTVAARMRELGVSEPVAFDLMAELWNVRCDPPWDAEELETKVQNAYRYAQNDAHSADATLDFVDDPIVQEPPEPPKGLTLNNLAIVDLSDIQPEPWVLGDFLSRGRVSALLGEGGIGKSHLTLGIALSISSGKTLIGMEVHDPGPVLLINGEDPDNMMKARFSAWILGLSLDKKKDGKNLDWLAFEHEPLKLVKRGADSVLRKTTTYQWLEHYIQTRGIRTLIVDPWVECHDAEENSNTEVAKVTAAMRQLAFKTNCAVLIVHHVRKGAIEPGDMNAARGASSLLGACRTIATYCRMPDEDADKYGVQPWRYARFDFAKNNLAPVPHNKPSWFEMFEVQLPSGDTQPYLQHRILKPIEADHKAVILDALLHTLEDGPVPLTEAANILSLESIFSGVSVGKIKASLRKEFAGEGAIVGDWKLRIEKIGRVDNIVGHVREAG